MKLLLRYLLMVTAASAALLVTACGGADRYRFDVIFDNSKGVGPGQVVKIAGARAGVVSDVNLTSNRKARVSLEIDQAFAPFKEDASCRILPEGFISENYVDCQPGAGDKKTLAVAEDTGLPTIPVERTSAPVSLQDLINMFTQPVNQRLSFLINELGIATAGRGDDIAEILARTNPSLKQVRSLLTVIQRDQSALEEATSDLAVVTGKLASRKGQLRQLISAAAGFSQTTGSHSKQLVGGLSALPPMLRKTNSSLGSVDRAAASGAALLTNLRRAAPALRQVNSATPGFAASAGAVLPQLGNELTTGSAAMTKLQTPAANLQMTSKSLAPTLSSLQSLLVSTRDTGGLDGLLRLTVGLAGVTSMYDGLGHIMSLTGNIVIRCILDNTAKGCQRRYNVPGNGTIPINDPNSGSGYFPPPYNGPPVDPEWERRIRIPVAEDSSLDQIYGKQRSKLSAKQLRSPTAGLSKAEKKKAGELIDALLSGDISAAYGLTQQGAKAR